jgi:hypothetical protein
MAFEDVPSRGSWKTASRLLKCRTLLCPGSSGSSEDTWKSFSFAVNQSVPFFADITCGDCDDHFSVCIECPNATSQLRTADQIKRHCRHAHKAWLNGSALVRSRAPKQKSRPDVSVEPATKRSRPSSADRPETVGADNNSSVEDALMLDGENDSDFEEASVPETPEVTVTPVLKQSDIGVGCRENNAAYFYKESKVEGGGLDYLVGMAAFEVPDLDPGTLDKDEVSMYANTASFACQLSQPNRARFADLTKQICDVVKKQTLEEVEVSAGKRARRPFLIEPLQTPNEIRMQFFDKEKSLFNLLPHPPLFECEGHTYSLYSDCIRDALGKGFDLEFITPNDGGTDHAANPAGPVCQVPTTRRCKMLFDLQEHVHGRVPIITVDIYLNEWSDDAEPANSIKNHRGSLWFKSVTVSPTKIMAHSMSHTYPLALGRKEADHEHVGRLLAVDLRRLGSDAGVPMYSVRHGGIVLVRAKIYACLMDQPERRGENHLLAGNSNQHKRFGFSFPWHEFEDVLRPCQICRDVLLDESQPWESNKECPRCTNFAYDPYHPLFAASVPADFPLVALPGEMLGPLRLSYHLLANAVNTSHDFLVNGVWNEKEATAYLDWHCIKKKSLKAIILHADHCREYNNIMEDPLSSIPERAAATREKDRQPHLHAPWPLPSLWERGVLLEQSPDVPMHLLFLGLVKTTMLRIQQWMSNKRKMAPFVRAMKKQFDSLDKLKLSWIKILPYKAGKFGGWISENYLAISRLLKWFYSSLSLIASDPAPWQEPNKPPEKWTMVDNKAWLTLHGFPSSDLSASELTAKVLHCMTEVHPFPDEVAMSAGPVETVMATVSSLDELISLIMVESIPGEEYYSILERKIRVFLTHFADMEEKLPLKKKLPSWLSCYNFLSLLNLPDVIRNYGPIRNIWEGAAQGEGILRFVKPNVSNGMRRAWENATMKALMRKKSMAEVANSTVGTEEFVESKESSDKMYHRYDVSLESLDFSLRLSKEVFSCVQLEDKRWGVVTKRGSGTEVFNTLERSAVQHINFRLNYFSWKRHLEVPAEVLTPGTIVSFGLLLPLLQWNLEEDDDEYETHNYAMIDSQHRTLNVNGDLCYA